MESAFSENKTPENDNYCVAFSLYNFSSNQNEKKAFESAVLQSY